MKYVYLTLSWMFGILFALAGFTVVFLQRYSGLAFLVCATILLPPVRKFTHSKTKWVLSANIRGWSVTILAFVGLFFFSNYTSLERDREARKTIESDAQKQIDYFNKNSETIIANAKLALSENRFSDVLDAAKVFEGAGSIRLAELGAAVKSELDMKVRTETTEEILALLKTIPASNYRQNRNLYKELVDFHRDNPAYVEKHEYYSRKLDEQLEQEKIATTKTKALADAENAKIRKERNSRVAKYGEAPIASGWDGSYYVVERYLKRIANDPDSIEMDGCTKVYFTEDGWLVGCNYRGRNAFGGVIRQTNWFTVVHDQVFNMHDYSAFRE